MLRDSWIAQYRKLRHTDRMVQHHARQALLCRKRMLHGFAEMSDVEILAWSGGLALLLVSRSAFDEPDGGERSGPRRLWTTVLLGWRILMRARTAGGVLHRIRREANREVPPLATGEERHHAV